MHAENFSDKFELMADTYSYNFPPCSHCWSLVILCTTLYCFMVVPFRVHSELDWVFDHNVKILKESGKRSVRNILWPPRTLIGHRCKCHTSLERENKNLCIHVGHLYFFVLVMYRQIKKTVGLLLKSLLRKIKIRHVFCIIFTRASKNV